MVIKPKSFFGTIIITLCHVRIAGIMMGDTDLPDSIDLTRIKGGMPGLNVAEHQFLSVPIKRIIEAHDGRIWVESEGLGKGTTVCFTLPGAGEPPTDNNNTA
jgi:hypothetical protein